MRKNNSPHNSNFRDGQNQSYREFDRRTNQNGYYQNPQRPVRYPDKRKKRNTPGLSLLIKLICLLVAVIIVYVALYINIFSYKPEITDVLTATGSKSAEIIEDIKVSDNLYVYAYTDNGRLSASYIKVKGSGDSKSYKCLKRCGYLNIDTYKKDMQGKKMKFSSKGDFRFGLDFSGSEQYDQFTEYFDKNEINDYKSCPVNIEGVNQIFIVWMWNE